MKFVPPFLISIAFHAAVLALPISHHDTTVEEVMPVTLLRLARDNDVPYAAPAPPRAGIKSQARQRPARLDRRDTGRGTIHAVEFAADAPTIEPATHENPDRQLLETSLKETVSEQQSRISLQGGEENGGAKSTGAGNSDVGPGLGGNGTRNGGASDQTLTRVDYAHNPKPPYPERAQREGWEGTVLLRVLVNQEGKPQSVEVGQSSGFEALDRAAVKTVQQWRFHPARSGQKEIESWVKIPIVFKLTDLKN